MHYIIYKTINIQNNKFYVGKHQSDNLSDNYLGSGIALKSAIKKYGRKSFRKEILFIFETEDEMNAKEIEIVTEEFVADKNTYNTGVGGKGGPHFKNKKHTDKTKETIRKKLVGTTASQETKDLISYKNSLRVLSDKTKRILAEKQHLAQLRKKILAGSSGDSPSPGS